MISNEAGLQFHNRETQGETLTPEEKSQLESWYASQDAEENSWINSKTASPETDLLDIYQVQQQTSHALQQLTGTTQRIQEVMTENAALRCEITSLKKQLITAKSV